MEHEAVGGILADAVKKYILDQLSNAKVDIKGFVGDPDTRAGLQLIGKSAKKHATAPLDLDDKGIDYLLKLFDILAEQYKNLGPVTVGATPEEMEAMLRPRHTREEVEKALREVGIDPITIIGLIMTFLQYAPVLLEAIKKLFGK
jgi:hypothetical protein